ncbi:MAG TPA: hypothetical protein VK446_08640, partial [Methylocystis sp.]|nr:hypothetical protein [Methylocystis sp.]
MIKMKFTPLVLVVPVALNACGLYVPEKDFLSDDAIIDAYGHSRRGSFENDLINHIQCQIQKGLLRVAESPFADKVSWLYELEKHVKILKTEETVN